MNVQDKIDLQDTISRAYTNVLDACSCMRPETEHEKLIHKRMNDVKGKLRGLSVELSKL